MAKRTRGRKTLRRSKKHSRRNQKLRGGSAYEVGSAPLSYSLADGWSSKMSLNQGDDYFKYHADQHGGGALMGSNFQQVLSGQPLLSGAAASSARVDGLDNAIAYSAQFKDAHPPALVGNRIAMPETTPQKGGKRRRSGKKAAKKSKKSKKASKKASKKSKKASKKSKKVRKTVRRRRQGGGSLGYASVNAPGLLLPTKSMYDDAGLNPEFRGAAAEYWSAEQRDAIQG